MSTAQGRRETRTPWGQASTPARRVLLAALHPAAPWSEVLTGAMAEGLPWEALLTEAAQQGILPTLCRRLVETASLLPPGVADRVAEVQGQAQQRSLRLSAKLLNVIRLLEGQGIPVMPIKGPVLAEFLYGDPTGRHFSDLDLLVRLADAPRAYTLLEAAGLTPRYPEPSLPPELSAKHRWQGCEFTYLFPGGERLDVHWELLEGRLSAKLPTEEAFARHEMATLIGQPVRMLDRETLLLYLCLHAAHHGWNRLGMLGDVSALVTTGGPWEWEAVLVRAREQGALRSVLLTLALANGLLDLSLPDPVRAAIERDRRITRLRDQVADRLLHEACRGLTLLEEMRLLGRIADRWSADFGRRVRYVFTPTATDWCWVRLPRPLWGLYPVLRPLRQVGWWLRGQYR